MKRLLFDVPRWHLYLHRDGRSLPAKVDGPLRQLEDELYAGEGSTLPEDQRAPAHLAQWAEGLHGAFRALPAFERLARQCRGDADAAAAARVLAYITEPSVVCASLAWGRELEAFALRRPVQGSCMPASSTGTGTGTLPLTRKGTDGFRAVSRWRVNAASTQAGRPPPSWRGTNIGTCSYLPKQSSVSVSSTDAPGHSLVRAIQDTFVQLRDTHTADDVRRTVVRTLHTLAAVTLREGGGVYWVPRTHATTVRKLERAVGQLGKSTFHVVPVHHTDDASRTLGVVARGSLETELSALREELESFKAQPPDRPSTLERRLEAFEALRGRAQLYRDILHVQVEDLESHLATMAATVQGLLAGQEAA